MMNLAAEEFELIPSNQENFMRKLFLAAALASVAAAPALAADAVVYDPAPPAAAPVVMQAYDWSGFYLGGQLGYGWGDAEVTGVGSVDGDGFLGGGHVGYNFALGNVVLGVEADYDFANIELEDDLGEIDAIARGKLKVGYALDRALPYLTGGIAHASVDTDLGEFEDTGYALGAGLDYAVTDNVIVGAEYLFHTFDDFDDSGIDVDVNTFKAKVSFKF